MRWSLLLAAAIPLLFTTLRAPATPSFVWWTTHALEKVRPYDSRPESPKQDIAVFAARNEFEPFQIVLRANAQQIPEVDVHVSDLRGPAGAVLSRDHVRVHLEHFIDLEIPSSNEGKAGEWPDALIPQTDRYFEEKRRAFPVTLKDGRNQPIWIEVYVPPTTVPGSYNGEVSILSRSKRIASAPLRVEVWNFTLPSTSSLQNTFGFNGVTALRKHKGRYTNDVDLDALTHLYRKSALLHRLSVHGGSLAPPQVKRAGGEIQILWNRHDQEVGPFLNGTVLTEKDPLPGARSTTIELNDNLSLKKDAERIAYYQQYVKHFREKGWFDRLFYYLWDEPKDQNSAELIHRGRLVHQADPSIRRIVAAPFREEWRDVVDIWTPLVNCFESKPGFDNFCENIVPRSEYPNELWWYQSCGSHGCDIIGGDYFRGWPSYMVDHSAVSNRIMPWLTWKYDIKGELYFNLNEAFSRRGDPWTNVRYFGGNGDGTLFYPGTPERIGGKTDIPIESIRLKLIREGLEDYEYLLLYASKSGAAQTDELVAELVRSAFHFNRDPAKLYDLRQRMGKELSR